MVESYFAWLLKNTLTSWWHDSGDPGEMAYALENGASGVTTNPMLCHRALLSNRKLWSDDIQEILDSENDPVKRAESLVKIVVRNAADRLLPIFQETRGKAGYVCAQVNPAAAGERETMYRLALEFGALAPNIAIKLPVTSAGLDVLERCAAEGLNVAATVSFTVPQVIAVAERYRRGIQEAQNRNVAPGKCFAVIMIGRIDDYLRDVARDGKYSIEEEELTQAGLAITKRAYSIFKEKGYKAILLIAALRGNYHMTELAGAELIMSIAPKFQKVFAMGDLLKEERIHREIPRATINKLLKIPAFARAYEPNGMAEKDFICYGVTQRTLSQFVELGWSMLESFGNA